MLDLRIILDTNVVINSNHGAHSWGSRIMQWVIAGELTALLSRQIQNEYSLIASRLVPNSTDQQEIKAFLQAAEYIDVTSRLHIVRDDPEDDKFFNLAVDGDADVIITDDKHLLEVEQFRNIVVTTPAEFVAWYAAKRDPDGREQWHSWMRDVMRT